jgi:hypothetical protein
MDEMLSGGEFVPDFTTHYYRASRAPFLNLSDLSDLPDEQAVAVMAELTRERRETEGSARQGRFKSATFRAVRAVT